MNSRNIAGLSALPTHDLDEVEKAVLENIEEIVVYSLPMNVKFRGITRREGLLLRGAGGWGETSPFWGYGPTESSRWLQSGIETAGGLEEAASAGRLNGDAEHESQVANLWRRDSVPVNLTVSVVSPADARRVVLAQRGCKTAKVKVADPGYLEAEDVERVAAVAHLLAEMYGPDAKVRVDANTAWTVEEAQQALNELWEAAAATNGLEYAEQPVETTEELAELRGKTHVPLAADESIRRAENPLDVRRLHAADVGVVKVQPLGGVRQAMTVSNQIGLPTTVSSALDTSIGIAAAVAMSAAMENLPYAGGLNTATMFVADVVDDPLIAEGGNLDLEQALAVASGPLTGTSRNVDSETVGRWRQRLREMAHALHAGGGAPWWDR